MNTPAHVILGAAVFARPDAHRVTAAALLGGLAPDLSLYLLAGWHLLVLGTSADVVFRELYYSDGWQAIFGVDNSFILWGLGLGAAIWGRSRWAVAFTGAAMLHLAFDFPFHTHDARMHFWPVTDWKFHSPFSYWDGSRGGDVFAMVEAAGVFILSAWLILRFRHSLWKWVFAAIALAQLAPFFIWRLVF